MVLEKKHTARVFVQNLKLSVGSGTRIMFWEDQWVGNFTLKDKFTSLFSISTQQTALISTMGWFEGQVWKWALAWKRELVQYEVQLVKELTALISAHHPLPNQEHILYWKDKREFKAKVLH